LSLVASVAAPLAAGEKAASTALLTAGPVGISAASAIVVDDATGQVLWSRNPDTKRFPASTTKILTALLVRERTRPDEMIWAPNDVESVTGASLHLRPSEVLTAQNLLTGILSRSANDACYTAAVHIAGSVPKFADLMNARARELGATHTHFTNPHGLHEASHYTTARDLAIFARAAMKDAEIRDLVRERRHTIERSENQEDTLIISKNKYLDEDPTADGIKTGYTVPAGKCYVGSATRDGYRIITVVLKSENWEADHRAMLKWAFGRYHGTDLAQTGVPLGHVPVDQGQANEVALGVAQTIHGAWLRDAAPPEWRLRRPLTLSAPIRAGQVVGDWVAFCEGKPLLTVPAVALSEVSARSWIGPQRSDGGWNAWIAAGILAAGSSVLVRRRPRRR